MTDFASYGLAALGMAAAGTAAGAAYILGGTSYEPMKFPVSLDNQSFEVEPGVRASHFTPDGKLVEYIYEDAKTLYSSFKRGIRVSNNGNCMGTRTGPNLEYVWLSYQQVFDRAHRTGSGLVQRGLQPGSETIIGIYASNRPEWVISEQACNMFSFVVVPLYDTLGTNACAYIINQTSMNTVICDKSDKAKSLLDGAGDMPTLKTIVMFDAPNDDVKALAQKHDVAIILLSELEEFGANNLKDPVPPTAEDLATICYTSGTTGDPKGVMLSHKSIVSNVAAVMKYSSKETFLVTPEDVHISYLPLAHMFERVTQCLIFMQGAQVGFSRGDVRLLTDDLKFLKPTLFATVPRLLNRVYDKVVAGVKDSVVKSFLFNTAVSQKMELLKKGIITKNSIWDKLVFHKVQETLGGRVKAVLTGSAPLAVNVLNFTRVAFGCMVFEGYGQTEAAAAVTFTLPNDFLAGHVGPPVPCMMVKLADVPEMEYYAKDNKGEVCCKGPNNMMGYYKNPEKTREAIDEDGWLHTGDVGQWLPNGTLQIVDRKKHIFKLAQGEYLAPEKIEGVYLRSHFVGQAFVDGNSLQTFPVAVIVPDPEVLVKWAAKRGISGNMEALCQNPAVKKTILADVQKIGKSGGLKGFEQVKDIYLWAENFSVENGLLTPTFKSKRPDLRKFFAKQIEQMYANAAQ